MTTRARIESGFGQFAELIVHRPWWTIAIMLAITVFMGFQMPQVADRQLRGLRNDSSGPRKIETAESNLSVLRWRWRPRVLVPAGTLRDHQRSPRPSVNLLDLNLPGTDGREVLETIKGDDDLKAIPVIVLTSSSDERDIDSCYQLGANTYIHKPVDLAGFMEAIGRMADYWFASPAIPHAGHPTAASRAVPHSPQNPAASGFEWRQLGIPSGRVLRARR